MGGAAGAVPRAVRAATGAGVGYARTAVLTAVPAVERSSRASRLSADRVRRGGARLFHST